MIDPYKEISIEEFKSTQEKISKLNLQTVSVGEIVELLSPLRNGFRMMAMQFDLFLTLYRGVIWNDKPETVDKLSYPPIEASKVSRAGGPTEQFFYSSTFKNICLYEMNIKKGDKIAISQWRPNHPLIFFLLGYTEDNLRRLGSERRLEFGKMKYAEERFAKTSVLQIEIMEYLSQIFCQPINSDTEDKYKLTSAVALLFEGQFRDSVKNDGRFSGLTYPSIKGSGNHDNFAVKSYLIDNGFLEFQSVEFVEILDYDQKLGKYRYKIIDYADSATENHINWKQTSDTWTIWDDEEIFFNEGIPVKAFTSDGEEYLPD